MGEKVGLLTKDGDVEPFYVCDFFTLISSVPPGRPVRGAYQTLMFCVKFTHKLARFNCFCDGFSEI
jgi:hypothetical protein